MAQELSTRESYGHILVELGRQNPDIVVLDADLCHSTQTKFFAEAFPERFFNCGIAEQNMVSIAAGLAAAGKIPFASTFAVFAPGRCFDQIRVGIAQSHLNVKIVTTHSGISVGEDGMSHQAIEDLSLTCSLPGFNVVVPADAIETEKAIKVAVDTDGPFYIRLGRPKVPVLYDDSYQFTLGKAVSFRTGGDVSIVATGIMVNAALQAADELKQEGIDCTVLNIHTLKPLDAEAITEAAQRTGAMVVAEEHLVHGGLGSSVAQVAARTCPVPMEFIGMQDTYAQSGKPALLMERYGLTPGYIKQAVKTVLQRKK